MSILRIAVVGFLLVGTAICFKCRTETGECETGTDGACFIRFSLTTRRCSIGCFPTKAVPTIDLDKKAPCEWTSEHVQCACFTEGCNMNTSSIYRLPESLQYCIEEFQDSSEETYDYSHGSWTALSEEDLSRKVLHSDGSSSSEEEEEIVHVHPVEHWNSTEEVISEKTDLQIETMLRAKRNVVESSDQSSSEGSGEGSGNSDDEYDDDDANSDETVTSTLSEGDDVVEHKENENGLDSNEESEESEEHIVEIPSPESVDGLNQTVQSETQESDKQVPSTLVELPESPKPEETNSNNVDFDPRGLPLPLLIPQSGSLSSLVTAGIVTIVNFVIFAQ